MSPNSRPIIIVTGANSGVGYAICQRLLEQLCHEKPVDFLPQSFCTSTEDISPPSVDGLTLILACRSLKKAETAKKTLRASLDKEVQKVNTEYARTFRKNVSIDLHHLDLASLDCVWRFSQGVTERYPYISHIIANAGAASYIGMNWYLLICQFFTDPMGFVTNPRYSIQAVGERTMDGFGYVWQCNVFAHYVLYRLLEKTLKSPAYPAPARVIWTSSLEGHPRCLDLDDFQLLKNPDSYSTSKYEIDLIGAELARRAKPSSSGEGASEAQHLVSHPGIFVSNISYNLTGSFLQYLQTFIFLVARWCGSPNHTLTADNAAVAAVHLCLAPFVYLTSCLSSTYKSDVPLRYGSATDIHGKPYVLPSPVVEWESNSTVGAKLLDKMDNVYETLLADWTTGETNGSFISHVETFDPKALASGT